jgi:hypothetical protein
VEAALLHKLGAIRWRDCSAVRVVLSIVHSGKFSEAVIKALSTSQGFGFERDVLRQDVLCQDLLEMERCVVGVDEPIMSYSIR